MSTNPFLPSHRLLSLLKQSGTMSGIQLFYPRNILPYVMVYTLLYRINTSCTVFQFSFTNAMLDAIPEGTEGESGGGETEGLFFAVSPVPFFPLSLPLPAVKP